MRSAQRSASSTVMLDSIAAARPGAHADAASSKSVSGRTFTLANGTWTDSRPAGTTRVVTVRAYSAAYFDLIRWMPELGQIFKIGEQVRVAGRAVIIEVRTDRGIATLTPAELTRIS